VRQDAAQSVSGLEGACNGVTHNSFELSSLAQQESLYLALPGEGDDCRGEAFGWNFNFASWPLSVRAEGQATEYRNEPCAPDTMVIMGRRWRAPAHSRC
jgi:hypothetical protein